MDAAKTQLYTSIVQHQGVTYALRELLRRIFYFMMHTLTPEEIIDVFRVPAPVTMCGYTNIGTAEEYMDVMLHGNQREMLTCIYRFATKLSSILWHRLLPHQNIASILTFSEIDRVYLKRKMSAILYSYNVLDDGMTEAEMVQELLRLFSAHIEAPSHHPAKDQVTLIRSFTRLHGSDPLVTFSGSRASLTPTQLSQMQKVRFGIRQKDNENEFVPIDLVEPLSQREQTLLAQYLQGATLRDSEGLSVNVFELPWITGSMLYTVDPDSLLQRYAAKNNKLVRTGMSGTTQLMLECASIFGIDCRYVFLALVPWMDTARDHSLFEIVMTAQSYLPVAVYKVSNNDVALNEQTELIFTQLVLESLPQVPIAPAALPSQTTTFSVQGPVGAQPMMFFGGKKSKKAKGGDGTMLAPRPIPLPLSLNGNVMKQKALKQVGLTYTSATSQADDCFALTFTPADMQLQKRLLASNISVTKDDIIQMKALKFPNEPFVNYLALTPFSLPPVRRYETRAVPEKYQQDLIKIKGTYAAISKQDGELPPTRTDSPQWMYMESQDGGKKQGRRHYKH